MDYCHPCRRHLNGALACAGCGTPAEALGPYAMPAAAGPAPDEPYGTAARADEADAPRRTRRDARRDAAREPRPSRRRARGSHRRRGRTVLLGALGLLLAAGALSLAELALEPGQDDTAADFVSDAPGDPAEPAPTETSADAPRDPGPVGSRAGATTGPGTDARPVDARSGSPDPSGSPSPDASTPDEPTASPEPDETDPSDAPDSPPADPPGPGDPQQSTTAPAPPPPPAEPTPSPTPSPTCTRFLWWCT
ncbi:hypothetical protein AB0D07_07315 [Streptomyces globisporus]|uniref:SCO2400 family protein n=1 Tax=Streptomyces globisporus TaxID=1908 RepID=UPI00346083FB